MIAHMTASETSRSMLPADGVQPVFALSMNRLLRSSYNGEFFRFSDGTNEYDYPSVTPTEGDKIVKIYDQRVNPLYDATQSDPSLQPTVKFKDGVPCANFSSGQYLEIDVASVLNSANFVITIKGESSHPRPLFSCWGDDVFSIEPGEFGRYKFNEQRVTLPEGNRIAQIFCGNDRANKGRVIEVKNAVSEGALPQPKQDMTFDQVAIGRSVMRHFEGTFSEMTFHNTISEIARNKIWEGVKDV